MEEDEMSSLLIFGCGKKAKEISGYIDKRKNKILYYIDNDVQRVGKEYLGKPVMAPSDILGLEYDYVLTASIYWKEMRQQLLDLGVARKKIKCPLAPTKLRRFRKEYGEIYNILGKMCFYYDRWYLAEQFHPDFVGVFVNPYYFSRKMLYDSVKSYAPYMTGSCMDFGCGISPYKRLLTVDEYIGVEIETEDKRQGIIYYDGYNLPFENGRFDCIISSEVFEHVFNIEDIVLELNRVLKRGGIMLLTIPFAYPKHCEPHDFRRWTMEGVRVLLGNAGFEIVEGRTSSGYWECIAQFQNVYWAEEVKPRTFLTKMIRRAILVSNNIVGVLKHFTLPHSEKLYLDNVIVARKK